MHNYAKNFFQLILQGLELLPALLGTKILILVPNRLILRDICPAYRVLLHLPYLLLRVRLLFLLLFEKTAAFTFKQDFEQEINHQDNQRYPEKTHEYIHRLRLDWTKTSD